MANGLTTGGLVTDTSAGWTGADTPTQTTTSDGSVTVTVVQTAQNAILNWSSFNVGKKTTLYFNQTAGGTDVDDWIVFNKVNDPSGVPSKILGSIKAEGQVYIINHNGIIFGNGCQVDTHALVASAVPINDNLIDSGILDNSNYEFLFNYKDSDGNTTSCGDVIVEEGAVISCPTDSDNNGGKVILVGANVTNAGTISTPDGQTILAAGLQVGFTAHSEDDSTLRGLDVFIGESDGTAENSETGLIYAPRASVIIAGKAVNQMGVIYCTTSVSLNGRIDLLADYDCISQSTSATSGVSFLPQSTGVVTLGEDSVTAIVPETDSTDTDATTSLTLTSIVNIQGRVIYMGEDALIYAPGATTTGSAVDFNGTKITAGVTLQAGEWYLTGDKSQYLSTFETSGGQVYLDEGATISVAGLTGVAASVSENIVTISSLTSTELADYVVQRDGVLYDASITYDSTESVSVADVSGYNSKIEHTVAELSINGGTISISAGDSVVLQKGSVLDVSGGWISYTGATVTTTRLVSGGNIYDISEAAEDIVYDSIYSGFTEEHSKWGVSSTYTSSLLKGTHYESGYTQGGNGGSITITSLAMVLDGEMYGNTVTGEKQTSDAPTSSSLTLTFEAQVKTSSGSYKWVSSAVAAALETGASTLSVTPEVVIAETNTLEAADDFSVDSSTLREDRQEEVFLSSDIINKNGFGNVTIDNSDGSVVIPEETTLEGAVGGSLTIEAANITIKGKITIAGGSMSFTVYDYSPTNAASLTTTPDSDPTRGNFVLGSSAVLDASGSVADDREGSDGSGTQAYIVDGGSVTIKGYNVDLEDGSVIDVSGGVYISAKSKLTYGSGGSITIQAGYDPSITSLIGGKLYLGATLLGYGGLEKVTVSYTKGNATVQGSSVTISQGTSGGTLSITTTAIQIGGSDPEDSDTLWLSSDFFNEGGFSTFNLTGLGKAVIDPATGATEVDENGHEVFTAGVTIAAGTTIAPQVLNHVAVLGSDGSVTWETIELEESLRAAVSLTFKATGVNDKNVIGNPIVVRGDVVLEEGAVIDAGYQGSVTLSGQTVDVEGSIYAPGGSITITGATESSAAYYNSNALATVVIGSNAVLDASGAVMLIDDGQGDLSGAVLDGGTITITGNIVASLGAVLDVSGASGTLEIPGNYLGISSEGSVTRVRTYETEVDSSGGTITLTGGEMLYSDATLLGAAGGSSADGGTLVVSSGYYDSAKTSANEVASALYPTLVITQSGLEIGSSYYASGITVGMTITSDVEVEDPNGAIMDNLGHFTVSTYEAGGFDSLTLKGTLVFSGDVTLTVNSSLTVATSGVIYATGSVKLTAAYISIGSNVLHETETQTEYASAYAAKMHYSPTYGEGVLTVSADLIDIGDLTLRDIGEANFIADDGDIRGSGTLDVAGDIYLRAGQIYPPTETSFTIIAYDHDGVQGSVTIAGSGTRSTPLSAGGEINIYASIINQGGVLRAPDGTINLGWNGEGDAPVDTVTGLSVDAISGESYPVCDTVTLLAGSITSVSADGQTIPYGTVTSDGEWIDPSGTDITSSGPTDKTINISGKNIDSEAGSTVDLSGGGDLYAYEFVSGTGGSTDVLLSSNSYAIVPASTQGYASTTSYNTSSSYYSSDSGYVSSSLKVGDTIYLSGCDGLPAGYYTLLPARYALLSGAYLITVSSSSPTATAVKCTDGSYLVSGYYSNTYSTSSTATKIYVSFEVSSSEVVRARASYTDYSANDYFTEEADTNSTTVPRLPQDAGTLVISALSSLSWSGSITGDVPSGGRGSQVDISSVSDLLISGESVSVEEGTLLLTTSVLNAISADSLLIGGTRDTNGNVTVTAETITVDNEDSALIGKDIILAASESITLAEGADIEAEGTLAGSLDSISVSGDGAVVRVSVSESAGVNRSDVSSSSVGSITIGSGARLTATYLTLDSAAGMSLDSSAFLNATVIALHSGQISIELGNQGTADLKTTDGEATTGLVLSGNALSSLMASARELELVSYSSIDIYGEGTIGDSSYASLTLQAAEIRAFNQGNVTFTAKTIELNNNADVSVPSAVDGESSSLAGSLTFNAEVIKLGENELMVSLYQTVTLNASEAVVATGEGEFYAVGNLNIATPLISGVKASDETIKAGGALTVTSNGGTANTDYTGLGATLVLEGASVSVDSKILLPSGDLTLYATKGDVSVGGDLDVSGVAKGFYDTTDYTDGGAITLTADKGNVSIGSSGVVTVAAQAGGGDAGTLTVNAVNGTLSIAGTLEGGAGTNNDSGSFVLDVGSLSSTAWLDSILNDGSFDYYRKYRVRNGNVAVDGYAKSETYRLSADKGDIIVTGTVDAKGTTGGTIYMAAHGDLELWSGALLTVYADDFNSAGEGGSITLEAGDSTLDSDGNYTHEDSAWLDIREGSTIELGVLSYSSDSASQGDYTGILHLRAPQNATATDLNVETISGTITGASAIIVEGYKTYTPTGGSIDSVEALITANGNTFLGAAGSESPTYSAMYDRLFSKLLANDSSLKSVVSIRVGAEIVNTSTSTESLQASLSGSGSTITVPTETTVTFPNGTGSNTIYVTSNATITYSDGSTATLVAYTKVTLPAGASITFSNDVGSGQIKVTSGTSSVAVLLPSSSTNYFTTISGTTSLTPTTDGYTVELGKTSSKISVEKGATLSFTNGTPGNDKITSSVSGTITLSDGTKQTLNANTATTLSAGSTVVLNSAGTITFASGSGGAICVSLSANHTYAVSGTVYISTSVDDLTLGNIASTGSSDWNLSSSNFRFGPDSAPGVLTLRTAGNIVLYNSISDGFVSAAYNSLVSDANSLLSTNAQSWSYRIVAGADLTGVDYSDVEDVDDIDENSGSVLLGKYALTGTGSATTASAVSGYYQVIRTGSGDIEIYAGRNVKLRNHYATIYTAGTLVSDADSIWTTDDFDVPQQNTSVGTVSGSNQQSTTYPAQYTMAGGDVTIVAGEDIEHETLTKTGIITIDSQSELPNNWLYRRGSVETDENGNTVFSKSYYGETASTTWWVDFSNFFEGVGALGGGNVTMIAGNDIINVDAVIPTNARMPKATTDESKLLELGGGDLVVKAGNDISGGVYYVENGEGTLYAGDSILTNAARDPSYTVATNTATSVDSSTSDTWLPTTLYLGKGSFDVSAEGDVLLGPVVNTFLMPEGINNTYWYKTYFSTYAEDSSVTVSSLTGDVTLREETTTSQGTMNILLLYIKNVLLYSSKTTTTSYYEPWLRLDETSVDAFATACSLMPGTLEVTSFSGDINVIGTINLSPSSTGQLSLLCEGSVNGLNVSGNTQENGVTVAVWTTGSINLSDADPDSIPGVGDPFSYQEIYGTTGKMKTSTIDFLEAALDQYFKETGAVDSTLSVRTALHDKEILHEDDDTPVYIYAESGDISGLTLYSAKSAQIVAGNDITDIAFYIQNVRSGDVTIVYAGRDMVLYNASTTTRDYINSNSATNRVGYNKTSPLAGDIQISGPGTLEVLAGRDIDLGGAYEGSATSSSEIGVGITSVGNARNPNLDYEGADIMLVAGLSGGSINYSNFITQFLNPSTATNSSEYLSEIVSYIEQYLTGVDLSGATDAEIWSAFESLSETQQESVAMRLFFRVLRNAGRNHSDSSSIDYEYQSAYSAIAALFPGSDWSGDISLTHREIKTTHGVSTTTSDGSTVYEGGNITILVPGGELEVGYNDASVDASDQGIITEHGGQISIFADDSISLGTSRIFTLRGGDIIIWSTTGDIAAGVSSRTVKTASPTRVRIDPQSADVETDLAGLATGGGIGVLAAVDGVEPGTVDLIAPIGTVDAGEAGIRSTGDLYVSALHVLNANHIDVGGQSSGVTAASTGMSISTMTSAANTSAAVMNSSEMAVRQAANTTSEMLDTPSVITVEVLGYGGGEEDE
ncbi:MAG: filamentous hemagglutinin family protein [Chthoniobacteraceae bacterium]